MTSPRASFRNAGAAGRFTLDAVAIGLPRVSFHDAEVHALRLDRDGPTLELELTVVAPTPRMVRLRFENVSGLDLVDFNEQNVLFDLKIATTEDGDLAVEVQPTYGIGAKFRCSSVVEA